MEQTNFDNLRVGDYTLKEWEEKADTYTPTSSIPYEEAEDMGLLSPQQPQPQGENELYNTLDTLGIDHPQADKEYQELGAWDTTKDVLASVATEASHIFVPKDLELQYDSKTRVGENLKYAYRYIAGTAGFIYGGGLVGASIKGLTWLPKAGMIGGGIQKAFSGADLIKTGANASKAAKIGAKVANASFGGAVSGAAADFMLYRPEDNEGHFADVFGETDNALISYLQSDDNDTDIDAKLKNVVEGLAMGIGVGNIIEFGAKPLLKSIVKHTRDFLKGKTGAANDLAEDQAKLAKFTDTAELAEKVREIKAEADASNQEASQLLIDRLHPEDNVEAQKMLKVYEQDREPFVHQDGTWDISVETWEDAHLVSPEEYQKQLRARDNKAKETKLDWRDGDTAINHQDQAIRDTWLKRGWLAENEELTPTTIKRVVNRYADKFQIDNNIKLEISDGLIDGSDGKTSMAGYKGKTKTLPKTKQNAIDKKKLQISKLEDKITQKEGGNTPVADELANLKEELRIAKNELKELEKEAKGKNKVKLNDITIQINKNAKNPYATLRAELEHARDIAKGEVPDQNVQHFSRYQGLNEGEVAPDYVYKKATGKAKALNKTENSDLNISDFFFKKEEPKFTSTEYFDNTKTGMSMYDDVLNDPHYAETKQRFPKVVTMTPDEYIDLCTKGFNDNYQKYSPENITSREKLVSQRTGESLDKLKEKFGKSKFNMPMISYITREDGSIEMGSQEGLHRAILAKEAGVTEMPVAIFSEKRYGETIPNETLKENLDKITASYENKQIIEQQAPINLQQLKLDFNTKLETKQTSEELVTDLVSGKVAPTTTADIETLVVKNAEINPEISGFKWSNIKADKDAYVERLKEVYDEDLATNIVETYSREGGADLDRAIRKEMGAVDLMVKLAENVKKLGTDCPVEVKANIIDTIKHLSRYMSDIKSGFGRGLSAQKPINALLESYGATRLSSWTKEGIQAFSQALIDEVNDIISLNFTRGQKLNSTQFKQEIMRKLLERTDTHDMAQFLTLNKEMQKDYAQVVEKLLKNPETANIESMVKALQTLINSAEYNAMFKAAQKAPNKRGLIKTIVDWVDGQGGVTSYYVHNLLSGVGSLFKNVTSGVINTVYFPAKKILASLDPFIDQETRQMLGNEGWRTYKCMLDSWSESYQLMKEAFISGNGKLTNIGEDTLNYGEGQFRGFHEWEGIKNFEYYLQNPHKIWEAAQNFHSLMTRAMGATDEFMSQLNYRSITRSKSLQEAEKLAEDVGMAGNEQWINEEAKRIFNTKFNKYGQPTDVEALNEARTILYQNNLDGTMYDYQKGTKEQMREKTWVMKAAGAVQKGANDNAFLKLMFPFVKTGANILQMSLDHNIVYAAASSAQRALLKSPTAEGALARSQCAFGMFSLAIGGMMAFGGMITGSAPSDPKERKALFATGWRPYSFKLGNKYISYQGYEPLHGMLGFAADCANMYSTITNPDDEMRLKHFQEQLMPTLVNNFLDKAAFRTGLKQLDLILNPKDSDEWMKAMAQTAKGFLPASSFVTNTGSVGRKDVLQPKSFYERVFYRYFPEKWTPMDYRRNAFGEKQSIVGLIISSAGDTADTPEEKALEYLSKYGYSPSEIDNVIANTGLKFSDFKDQETGRSVLDAMREEMSTVTIRGKTLREAVRDLVTSEEYELLPDGVDLDTGARWGGSEDTKINAVNDIFLMYKQRAKRNIIRNSNYFVDKNGRTIQEANDDIQLKRLQQLTNLY